MKVVDVSYIDRDFALRSRFSVSRIMEYLRLYRFAIDNRTIICGFDNVYLVASHRIIFVCLFLSFFKSAHLSSLGTYRYMNMCLLCIHGVCLLCLHGVSLVLTWCVSLVRA